jgi:hypothetical protein
MYNHYTTGLCYLNTQPNFKHQVSKSHSQIPWKTNLKEYKTIKSRYRNNRTPKPKPISRICPKTVYKRFHKNGTKWHTRYLHKMAQKQHIKDLHKMVLEQLTRDLHKMAPKQLTKDLHKMAAKQLTEGLHKMAPRQL